MLILVGMQDSHIFINYSIQIIIDDLYLPFGECRLKMEGSSGGQNGNNFLLKKSSNYYSYYSGINSIIRRLGGTKIPRLKIGIRNNQTENVKFFLNIWITLSKTTNSIV